MMPTDFSVRGVTFDFGQTLCDLDTGMLSHRLAERGLAVPAERLEGAVSAAWQAYDEAILAGLGGHPWKVLMGRLLELGGVDSEVLGETVDWLWSEQPKQNLWRRPIEGMAEIVDDLRRVGVPVGVISNSEGRLSELIDEIRWSYRFDVVADSGKLGMVKPGDGIFRWTAERLGLPPEQIAHIGDSVSADVGGAIGAGMRAVLFRGRSNAPLPPGVRAANDAESLRVVLREWGLSGA
jgi:FMN phosphatase YigB (HAD superfamily)